MREKGFQTKITASDKFGEINSKEYRGCIVHLLCLSGEGSFMYNGKAFVLKKGDIAVVNQPQLASDIQQSDDFTCEYIVAPSKLLHGLLPANNFSIQGCVLLYDDPIIHVSEEDAENFLCDLRNIRRRISQQEHHFYDEMMGSLLLTMIYDLFDFQVKSGETMLTTDRTGYLVTRFFSMLMSGKPGTEREVSFYASQLNVTAKYLSDTIKRITGTSVSTYINRAAVAIIKSYLDDNTLSITQISDKMHFTSVSYFSRYCSKHLGLSPANYRTARAKKRL